MKKLTAQSPRYGKLPVRHDSRNLMYEKYITASKLPPSPPAKHWEKNLPGNWGMMGNYSIADCTCASAGHLIMNWTGNVSKKQKVIPDKEIIAAYAAVSGYDPSTGANDYGANLLDVLNYWRTHGIGNDRLFGYVGIELGNHSQIKETVFLFGGCYIGLQLPDTATPDQPIWSVPVSGAHGPGAPNPNRGHAVPIVGYDERYLAIITWGKVKLMTWKFYDTYCDEAYALLSADWFNQKKLAPDGFNWDELQKDMKLITKPKKYFTSGPFSGVDVTDAFAAAAIKNTPVKPKLGNISWPSNLQPQQGLLSNFKKGAKINGAIGETIDALLIAYTDYETEALLEVFTGSSTWSATVKQNWYQYTHNFSKYKSKITRGWTNALKNGVFGYMLPFTIGNKKVLVYKSELHPKNNGKYLPFVPVMQQIIGDVNPPLILTTGTAGAIGNKVNCGDVIITEVARLHCQDNYVGFGDIAMMSHNNTELKNETAFTVNSQYIDYANNHFTQLSVPGLNTCHDEFSGNAAYSFLKKNDSPAIYQHIAGVQPMDIVSADYLTVDDTDNLEQLQSLGIMNDTDDAFAVYAIKKLSGRQPHWLSVRNASEPQITDPSFSSGQTLAAKIKQVKNLAGSIYGVYQYCTTLNSAFACWAIIAGL